MKTKHIIIEANSNAPNANNKDPFLNELERILPNAPRVGSVAELRAELAALPPNSDGRIIQIVGHGQPGQISVGHTRAGRYSSATDKFVLDSDPYVYGLLDGVVGPQDEVWLIGCSVGEDPLPPRAFVAGGQTLLFDLADMWRATVKGTTGIISPTDFDAEGYTGPLKRFTSVAKTVNREATVTQWAVVAGVDDVVLESTPSRQKVGIELMKMTDADARSAPRRDFTEVTLTDALAPAANVATLYGREIPLLGAVPAMPEYRFEAKLDGQQGIAEILLNGRVMRFRAGDVVRDFACTDEHQARKDIATLVRIGLKL